MSISGISGVKQLDGSTSVSGISPVGQPSTNDAPASVAGAHRPKRDTFQSDFSSLVKAVRGGDIGGAQSALTALQSDVTSASATYSPASTAAPTAASPAQTDLDALFTAVQAGDIAGAQAALGQLQSDVRSTGPHADHASLQGQIHGRGHGRGHGHQGSSLRADVAAAFQSHATAPAETPASVPDPAASPAPDPAAFPAPDPIADPAASPLPITEAA